MVYYCSAVYITDAEGNAAYARSAVVVFTSNLLVADKETRVIGFGGARQPDPAEARNRLGRELTPKLVDRMDAVIAFRQLVDEDRRTLVERALWEVEQAMSAAEGVRFEVAPDVVPWLADRVAEAGGGGRGVRRCTDQHFTQSVAGALAARPAGAETLLVSVQPDGVNLATEWRPCGE